MILAKLRRLIEERPARVGTLAGWYQQGCSGLAALVVVPLVIKGLPGEAAGLWFSFQGLIMFVNLADFGLSFVVARQVSYSLRARAGEALEKTDFIATRGGWEGVSDVYEASRRLFRWVSLAGLGLLAAIYHIVVPLGKLLPEPSLPTTASWYLLGASTLLSLQMKPHIALLEGLGKVYLTRFVTGTSLLVSGVAVVGVLYAQGTLMAMSAAVLGVSILQYGWLKLLVRSAAGGNLVRVASLPAGLLRSCFRVGMPMGLLNISAFLNSNVQVPLLGLLLGSGSVPGLYLAQRIGQTASAAVMQLIYPQLPLFTQELAAGKTAAARRRMRRIVCIVAAAGMCVQLAFYFGSPWAVDRWVGPGRYIEDRVLLLMAVDYLLLIWAVVWANFVLAAGTNPFVLSTFLSGALNVLILMWGAPRWGLMAVPLATLAAGLCTNYWYNLLKGGQLYRRLARA